MKRCNPQALDPAILPKNQLHPSPYINAFAKTGKTKMLIAGLSRKRSLLCK
ncbi:MAG: hypothetical protein H6541_13345 [Lentimicrobiaceae bacterium]|nr:hypothetical protein [Lentimicrobiaceae bacterium]MCO5264662.1 hypothetical protein [Lentimicrobium sp.]